MKKNIWHIFFFILGCFCTICCYKIYKITNNKYKEKILIIDKEYSLKERGFCFCKDIQSDISIDKLNEISLRNLDNGQSYVDIASIYNVDEQKKLMQELYNQTKNITAMVSNDNNIWITSDIHGDIRMLMEGLLTSGLITWNGNTKIKEYSAYNNQIYKVVYPDVQINNRFKGKYINLGDIVNKHSFGIHCLYLMHDIFEKTKNQNGNNDKVKMIIGNHEYADINLPVFNDYSPYKDSLLKFIDMFDVYYEDKYLSFTHAPMSSDLQPKNKNEITKLKEQIVNDKDFKVQHILWGVDGKYLNALKAVFILQKPNKIKSCNVSGHTHGSIDFGYNKRIDVLNVATDRFNKDLSKRGIIFRINKNNMEVYSYTKKIKGQIIENKLNKDFSKCH